MKDNDIAPNAYHTADPVCTGRKSYQDNYISGQEFRVVLVQLSTPYQLDQLHTYVFGAISSSSSLHPILYKAYYSMTCPGCLLAGPGNSSPRSVGCGSSAAAACPSTHPPAQQDSLTRCSTLFF